MDGNISMVQQNNVMHVAIQAMQAQVTLAELRQHIWTWGKRSGWYHTTVEIAADNLLITYYPSLTAGLKTVSVEMPKSFLSSLPDSTW